MYVYVYVTCNMFIGINKSQNDVHTLGHVSRAAWGFQTVPWLPGSLLRCALGPGSFFRTLCVPGRNLGRCWICIRKSSTADATGWLGMTGFGETVIAPSWLRKLGFTAQLSVYIVNIYIHT